MFKLLIGLLTAFFWHCLPLHGMQFNVKPNTTKCLTEEVPPGLRLTIQYGVIAVPFQYVDLTIRDGNSNTLESRQKIADGIYTLKKDIGYWSYEICYSVVVSGYERGVTQTVSLTTTKTKMKKENLEKYQFSLDGKILQLEDLANSILKDYPLARDKEAMIPEDCEIAVEIMLSLSTVCKFALCVVLASTQVLFICFYFEAKLCAEERNCQEQNKAPEERVLEETKL